MIVKIILLCELSCMVKVNHPPEDAPNKSDAIRGMMAIYWLILINSLPFQLPVKSIDY